MTEPHNKTRRRWLAYSLRSLLLLMLAAALLVGGWQMAIAPYAQQREVIEALNEAGAALGTQPGGPRWMRRFLDPEKTRTVVNVLCPDLRSTHEFAERSHLLPDLTYLHLTGWEFDDQQLLALAKNRKLRRLELDSAAVSDDSVAQLQAALPDLVVTRVENFASAALDTAAANPLRLTYDEEDSIAGVYLRGTAIADDALPPLLGLHKLRWLDLSSTKITDAAAVTLQQLRGPELIDLRSTALSDEAIKQLRAALPECEILAD